MDERKACQTLWNTTSVESFHSDVLYEIGSMYLIKESVNKDFECIFCDGKFSEDERGEIWIKCFSYSLWRHLDFTGSENIEYIRDFY